MGCEENKLIAFLSLLYECGKRRVFPYADIFPVIKARFRLLSSVLNPRGCIRMRSVDVTAQVLATFPVFCGISGSTSTIDNIPG